MSALLFGSISTLVDTSEMQREAFNAAFAEHGLDWEWDRESYLGMLDKNGGADRIAAYAAERGEDVDAKAVHQTKSRIFQDNLLNGDVQARPGVIDAIRGAKGQGMKVGFVTTTSQANVDAVLDALAPEIEASDFDVVVSTDDVDAVKPDPAAYLFALEQLGEDADACVAVEDNPGGVASANAAGVSCVAFPNANTGSLDFDGSAATVNVIDLDELRSYVAAA